MPRGIDLDLVGNRYGCYVVLRRTDTDEKEQGKGLKPFWYCRCDCGAERHVRVSSLLLEPKSCGVAGHRYVYLRHGQPLESFVEYGSWQKMRGRCMNPNHEKFQNYGGRGITIYPQWDDFMVFLRDMGPKPGREYSIERRDVDGNYEPGNCVWATNDEQCRNKTTTVWVERDGVRVRLVDLTEELGLSHSLISGRIRRGWDLERALTAPVREHKPHMTKKRRALLEQAKIPLA